MTARRQIRPRPPSPRVFLRGFARGSTGKALEIALRESCPGLLGHDRYEISSSLAIREYDGVHLPQWRCRVRCQTGSRTRAFIFHCTRQSDPPPPTIDFDDRFDKSRLIDGFEGCWFVWKIEPDEGGVAVAAPAPARLVPA